jgi:hypothetical protein
MIPCSEMIEEMHRTLDSGERRLSPRAANHVSLCPACARAWEELCIAEDTLVAVARLDVPAASDNLHRRVMTAVAAEPDGAERASSSASPNAEKRLSGRGMRVQGVGTDGQAVRARRVRPAALWVAVAAAAVVIAALALNLRSGGKDQAVAVSPEPSPGIQSPQVVAAMPPVPSAADLVNALPGADTVATMRQNVTAVARDIVSNVRSAARVVAPPLAEAFTTPPDPDTPDPTSYLPPAPANSPA